MSEQGRLELKWKGCIEIVKDEGGKDKHEGEWSQSEKNGRMGQLAGGRDESATQPGRQSRV